MTETTDIIAWHKEQAAFFREAGAVNDMEPRKSRERAEWHDSIAKKLIQEENPEPTTYELQIINSLDENSRKHLVTAFLGSNGWRIKKAVRPLWLAGLCYPKEPELTYLGKKVRKILVSE